MFEFVVEGRPVSQYASAKTKFLYKEKVRAAIKHKVQAVLTTPIKIIITHYFEGRFPGDLDNISKPICDALIGTIYVDDLQIWERIARRKHLDNAHFLINGASKAVVEALLKRKEFVYVEVMVMEHG